MAFVPNAVDLANYSQGLVDRRLFSLTLLPRSARPLDLERKFQSRLRGIPRAAGDIVIYWKVVQEHSANVKNCGWCHILCLTRDMARHVRGFLKEQEFIKKSNLRSKANDIRPNAVITNFTRISHLPRQSAAIAAAPAAPALAPALAPVAAPALIPAPPSAPAPTPAPASAPAAATATTTSRRRRHQQRSHK